MLPTSLPVGILSSFSKEGDGKKSAQNSSILTDHSSCYTPGMRKKKTTWLWFSWWENAALYIPTFPHPPWGREWGCGRGRGGGGEVGTSLKVRMPFSQVIETFSPSLLSDPLWKTTDPRKGDERGARGRGACCLILRKLIYYSPIYPMFG